MLASMAPPVQTIPQKQNPMKLDMKIMYHFMNQPVECVNGVCSICPSTTKSPEQTFPMKENLKIAPVISQITKPIPITLATNFST